MAEPLHIKFRERVRDLGEVYTQPREVNAMLDLIPDAFDDIVIRFLEPAAGNGREVSNVFEEPVAVAPGSAYTESYFIAGDFDSEEECVNYANYLCAQFVRFLVLQREATQNITTDRFASVPALSMLEDWTDTLLYEHFGLTTDEVDYDESSIHTREPARSLDSPIPATHLPGVRKYRVGDAPIEPDEAGDGE